MGGLMISLRFPARFLLCLALLPLSAGLGAADLPDLATVPSDLQVPAVAESAPAAGQRVWWQAAGWAGSAVRSALYLPVDWTPTARLPVLVEWPGNGGYRNAFGDESDGSVEGCQLGYGISAGRGFIWLCLPFVEKSADGQLTHALKWWGDVAETKRHTMAAVAEVCERFGGDPERVVLCGFSRGSIGCHYIGLHDDRIAKLWRAMICHSHYDGVIEKWPYPGADRVAAKERLQRLAGRPEWISHEGSVAATAAYLESTGVSGQRSLEALPFRNHSAAWVLRPLPLRERLRAWLAEVLP
jgi:hypothetical protein